MDGETIGTVVGSMLGPVWAAVFNAIGRRGDPRQKDNDRGDERFKVGLFFALALANAAILGAALYMAATCLPDARPLEVFLALLTPVPYVVFRSAVTCADDVDYPLV